MCVAECAECDAKQKHSIQIELSLYYNGAHTTQINRKCIIELENQKKKKKNHEKKTERRELKDMKKKMESIVALKMVENGKESGDKENKQFGYCFECAMAKYIFKLC